MPDAEIDRRPGIAGGRCPRREARGVPCPGRLLEVPGGDAGTGAPQRFRCNGPAAHELEIRDVTPARAREAAARRTAAASAGP